MNSSERVVAHVRTSATAPLSAESVAAAKIFILDSLGVALAGTRVPLLSVVTDVTRAWGGGAAARVWGSGERVPVATAAFVNSYLIHNQEFDCVHEGAVVHPMATVLATLLAHAETRDISGEAFVRACVLSVDIATSIGLCARNRLRFFRPAMCGALGVTAGLAMLEDFDDDAVTHALGLTYSQLSGTMQAHVEGSPVLPMQIGFNARAALTAIDLAARGVAGPRDFLTGPFGYFALMDNEADLAPLQSLGAASRMSELSHKPFPSGRATHGGIDGLLTLMSRFVFGASQIAAVRVLAPPLVLQLVDRPAREDMAPAYARLCLPYVAAVAALRGDVRVEDFEAAALANSARLSLAQRIEVLPNHETSLNALVPQRVEVDLVDGSRQAIDLPAVLGSPGRPLTRDRQFAKFSTACRSAARPLGDAHIRRIVDAVERLDSLDDVRMLADLMIS